MKNIRQRRYLLPLVVGAAIGVLGLCLAIRPRPASSAPSAAVLLVSRVWSGTGFPAPQRFAAGQTPSRRGTLPYVVSSSNRADKTLRLVLEGAGARVIGPYPPHAFLVEADAATLGRIARTGRFTGATAFGPADKVDPALARQIAAGAARVQMTALALAPEDRARLADWIVAAGGEILKGCLQGADSIVCMLPADRVADAAQRGDVRWLESFERPRPLNDLAVNDGAMNVRTIWTAHGLTGAGQVVSTSDTGIDTGDLATLHPDLADRVCGFEVIEGCHEADVDGHGTHTAGSICGTGVASDGEIRGVAYGARLWAWFCSGTDGYIYLPDDCGSLFQPGGDDYPSYIHSASWGSATNGVYTAMCREIDLWCWNHPEFLPVFSCGNEGRASSGERLQSVGSPAAAKNVLAVGATQNARTTPSMGWSNGDTSKTAAFSSRGPCADGRVKPEIAAPGVGILSTRSRLASYDYGVAANTNYAYNCGTSMSCPLVAGAAALVREWLETRRGFTNFVPSAALVKAVLTGGATGGATPDNRQGWGRADLGETLYPSNRTVFLVDRIPFAPGYAARYALTLTNAASLDVQLAWVDYPGTAGAAYAAPQLVNDLDLVVSNKTTGAVWFGNAVAGGDRTNTLECVRVESAEAGEWEIAVRSVSVTYDSNEGGAAALYVRGATADVADVREPETVTLEVTADSDAGFIREISPSPGVYSYARGTELTCSASDAVATNEYGYSTARHLLTGWTGSGSVPATGTNGSVTVTLERDSTIDWHWPAEPVAYALYLYTNLPEGYYLRWNSGSYFSTYTLDAEYWIRTNATFTLVLPRDAPRGDSFTSSGTWWKNGFSSAALTFKYARLYTSALPGDYTYLAGDAAGRTPQALNVLMDEPLVLQFDYVNVDATVPSDTLPLWWWFRYLYGAYLGELIDEKDAFAAGDPDGDGFTNEMEYGDLTDPVDEASFRFKIDTFSPTNLVFTGSVKGTLIVEETGDLAGDWSTVATLSTARTSVTNDVSVPSAPNGSARFFRVRMPKSE